MFVENENGIANENGKASNPFTQPCMCAVGGQLEAEGACTGPRGSKHRAKREQAQGQEGASFAQKHAFA